MSVSKILTSSLIGIDAHLVEVEVSSHEGLFSYKTVGLPDAAVRESAERVLSALQNIGFNIPVKKFTINLAPADMRKAGSNFDLPIALGILKAENFVKADLKDTMVFGELALDGKVRSVRGMISSAILAKDLGMKRLILPKENSSEAAMVASLEVIPVDNIAELIDYLDEKISIEPFKVDIPSVFAVSNRYHYDIDFAEIKGQYMAKRALEIATAGFHHLLMIGSPGSGKSMMAKRVVTILSEMTFKEAIETTKIHSHAGLIDSSKGIVTKRPYRSPHHTISDAGLIGGGSNPLPGEISLAHNGVLFLDELPEFRKHALESLREPLEDAKVTITRANSTVTYPSRFMLIAAMNPCPCGYFNSESKECICPLQAVYRYKNKISGPLFDRFDIHIEVNDIKIENIIDDKMQEESSRIRERVNAALEIQLARYNSFDKIFSNGDLTGRLVREFCSVSANDKKILKNAIEKLSLSARAYDKILKLSRTIADLERSTDIKREHLLEAIQLRMLDKDR